MLAELADGLRSGVRVAPSDGTCHVHNSDLLAERNPYCADVGAEECLQLLVQTGRVPEATFLARTYAPSQVSPTLALWRENLKQVSERAASALADPAEYPNLFPDLDAALRVEELREQVPFEGGQVSWRRLMPETGRCPFQSSAGGSRTASS